MMFYPQDLPKVKLLVFHLHLFKTLTSPPLDIENFCVYTVVYKWYYVLYIISAHYHGEYVIRTTA